LFPNMFEPCVWHIIKAMKTLGVTIPLMALAALCFAQDVQYNFDHGADFTKFKTYRWEKHPESIDIDEPTLRQLSASFDAELAKTDLKPGGDQSDLVIVYQLALKSEKEIAAYNSAMGYGRGWGRGWYGGDDGVNSETVSTLAAGSIALDMFDAKKRELVWRGVVTKTIEEGAEPGKKNKNMTRAIQKLLKNYPPKRK